MAVPSMPAGNKASLAENPLFSYVFTENEVYIIYIYNWGYFIDRWEWWINNGLGFSGCRACFSQPMISMATCASAFLGMICRACRTTCWEMLLSWLVLWHPKSDRDMWIFTAYSWRYIISHRLSPVISWMIYKWRHLCYTHDLTLSSTISPKSWILFNGIIVTRRLRICGWVAPDITRPCRSSNQSQKTKGRETNDTGWWCEPMPRIWVISTNYPKYGWKK